MRINPHFRSLAIFMALLFLTTSCMMYKDVMDVAPKTKERPQFEQFPESEFLKIHKNERIIAKTAERDYNVLFKKVENGTLVGLVWKEPVTGDILKLNDRYLIKIPLEEIQKVEVWKKNYVVWGVVGVASIVGFVFMFKSISLNFSPWDDAGI
jgi:hypothetical protein